MRNAGIFQIQTLPANQIVSLLEGPDLYLARDMIFEIRNQITALSEQTNPTTWQEAWNTATGAEPRTMGALTFQVRLRCEQCNGKRYDPRSFRPCHSCFGRGQTNRRIRFLAHYADIPASDDMAEPR